MKILVYGAGVLGSLYAARLKEAGHEVSILARGERLDQIRQHGIILEDAETGRRTKTRVDAVEEIPAEKAYDFAIVIVRKNQLSAALPDLAANPRIPSFLFMVNNAAGPAELVAALGMDRVLLGFPGAGGSRQDHTIRYRLLPALIQPTTIGELDGCKTARVQRIAGALRRAGFPVAIYCHMDAWLKTHVALVSPLANALYLAGGDNYRLAHTRDGIVLLVRAVKEGLRVLQALGVPITPARYRALLWIPEPVLVGILQRSLASQRAELVLARHANAARDEMLQLANEFRILARATFVPTPAIDSLYAYADPETPPMPQNSEGISMDWRGVWTALWALASLGLGVAWLRRKRVLPAGMVRL